MLHCGFKWFFGKWKIKEEKKCAHVTWKSSAFMGMHKNLQEIWTHLVKRITCGHGVMKRGNYVIDEYWVDSFLCTFIAHFLLSDGP